MNLGKTNEYQLSISMASLDSLGIRLYSNAAAVLAEVVANSYDADATRVDITWDTTNDCVVIEDNGNGMTSDQLNSRYLVVGYSKRKSEEGLCSPKFNRPYMGRKGIGKLSVFSIADHIMVESTKDYQCNGFVIDVPRLMDVIDNNSDSYVPEALEPTNVEIDSGTKITLTKLKSQRMKVTAAALRKRLARRFDIVNPKPESEGGFHIYIDGEPLGYKDRQDLKQLEYVWEIGDTDLPAETLDSKVERFNLADNFLPEHPDWKINGWIGTVDKPETLTSDEDSGSLKNIIVLARKRPIHESILDKLNFNRIFGNYLTGQIEADFLDLDDDDWPDIATSDRQRLMEDDVRVLYLQKLVRQLVLEASEKWAKERPQRELKQQYTEIPELKAWVDNLPVWQKKPANAMLRTIAGMHFDAKNSVRDRARMYKSAIFAFERVAIRQNSEDLDKLSSVEAIDILPILERQSSLESALYADIVESRMSSIKALENLTDENELEKAMQEHLATHLELLDPSWERATDDPFVEQALHRIDPEVLSKKEHNGRIDIRYKTIQNTHVIVELKRQGRKVDIDELVEQGMRYYLALEKLNTERNSDDEIQVVFVVGAPPTYKKKPPRDTAEDYVAFRLGGINGKILTYRQLIDSAQQQYQDFFDRQKHVKKLSPVIDKLNKLEGPSILTEP